MSDPNELVHARYTGTTDVVMPGLEDRPRCCEGHNHREGMLVDRDSEGERVVLAPDEELVEGDRLVVADVSTLVRHGDVILLDRYSAEGRPDFEVVGPAAAPRKPTRAELLAEAEARGLAVKKSATLAQLQEALAADDATEGDHDSEGDGEGAGQTNSEEA